jgi:hypothetical protein
MDKLSVSPTVIIGDGFERYLTKYFEMVYFDIISAVLPPASSLSALLLLAPLNGFLLIL